MKRADFVSPAARLEDALKRLEQHWLTTRQLWDDSVSQTVEDEFLLPLHGQVRSLLDAATKLAGVVQTAEQECSHPREQRFSV